LVETDGTWVGVILSQLDTVENAALYARGQQNSVTNTGNPFKPAVDIPGVPQGFVYQRSTISVNKRWFSEAFFARNAAWAGKVDLTRPGRVRFAPLTPQ
jgi:hypothetical protein